MYPAYDGTNIVNLVSSIAQDFGHKTGHKRLTEPIQLKKNVLLLVIDGLGYDVAKKSTILRKYSTQKITTVFPSTTAAAITTFLSGLTPLEHGIPSWFVHLRECGVVSTMLPWKCRNNTPLVLNPKKILDCPSLARKLRVKSHTVLGKNIAYSPYNQVLSHHAKRHTYTTLSGLFRHLKKLCAAKSSKRKYIYAYWPQFDYLSHRFGKAHPRTKNHWKKIEKQLERLVSSLHETTLIITADHGHIDTDESSRIKLSDHPKLQECLTLPLCGEPRAAFCYVHPNKVGQFKRYCKQFLGHACTVYTSDKLLPLMGIGKPHHELHHRIGDFILLMKKNYILTDLLEGEKKHAFIGNHGGLSREEMEVPLVIVQT